MLPEERSLMYKTLVQVLVTDAAMHGAPIVLLARLPDYISAHAIAGFFLMIRSGEDVSML